MTEKVLSQLQKEYRVFFLQMLTCFSVSSPAHLSKEQKSIFFTRIKKEWAEAKELKLSHTKDIVANEPHFVKEKTLYKQQQNNDVTISKESPKPAYFKDHATQTILSEPNKEQTNNLSILFDPNDHFKQEEFYCYPVVKMPKQKSFIKLPRNGRSNQKGYTEEDFLTLIKSEIKDLAVSDNFHMIIPFYNKPYEPDIVIFDKNINLYIDIEIDEPYDGYYRYPTHNYRAEDNFKQDNIRDLFFNESGWVVIRFTERQIALNPNGCIAYIKSVINSIYKKKFSQDLIIGLEEQWNENQSIQWQKNNYREMYLGIHSFHKRSDIIEVIVRVDESEPIEIEIIRTKSVNNENGFDEDLHKYFHESDKTGNAEYISVTTLIDRFFPFDILRYIQIKAATENKNEEDVLREFLALRDEAAEKGTELHKQIENYLTKQPYDDDSLEFQFFLDFEKTEILPRKLIFAESEKQIISKKFNVAGTVDCLYKNIESNDYVMVDWKRSKKLIIDGFPNKIGYKLEINELNQLNNCSYFKYAIQQNMYKLILEDEYGYKISSMILAVFHEENPKFYPIKLPIMEKETRLLLNSLNHKI